MKKATYKGVTVEVPPGKAGDHLKVWSLLWKPGSIRGAQAVGEPSVFDGSVLALVMTVEGSDYLWGTAFMVAPGVALTAAHVMSDHAEKGHIAAGGSMLAIGVSASRELQLWQVTRVDMIARTDLAVLIVEPKSAQFNEVALRVLACNAEMPSVASDVGAVGFRARQDTPFRRGQPIELVLAVSSGPVLDQFPTGIRQSSPAPSLAADIVNFGGLSGGPVFDADGRVIGVLSRGVADAYAIVELLEPALRLPVSPTWPKGLNGEGTRLGEAIGLYLQNRPADFSDWTAGLV